MSSNADKDEQVFKKNLWDFFLHFDPGQIYVAPKDVTHIEHPVTAVITAAFQQIKWSGFLMNSLGAIVATELNVWVIYFALRYCIYSEWI